MKDTDKILLIMADEIDDEFLDPDDMETSEWVGTWKEFVDDNIDAGMEREEIEEVAGSLDRGDDYMFGGGAASTFLLRKVSQLDIWKSARYLYPIPDGFENSSYRNDAAPSYRRLDGRCVIWLMDEAVQRDVYGWRAVSGMVFAIHYHPTQEVYGLDDEEMTVMLTYEWDETLKAVSSLI